MSASSPWSAAFPTLEGALMRRRFARLDLRLRIELFAFAVLAAGFFAWQVRIPLDGLTRHRGPEAALAVVGLGMAGLLALGALVAGLRHRRVLESPHGPPWLALPVPPAAVAAHLERMSALWTTWVAVPAIGALVAAIGLAPPFGLVALALGFAVLLRPAGRSGAALVTAWREVTRRDAQSRHALETVLWNSLPRPVVRGGWALCWERRPAAVVLAGKDLALSLRGGSLRRRLVATAVLILAAAALWQAPLDTRVVPFAAFALALLAATTYAEWIVELCGSDPFAVLRTLPLGVGTVWGARVAWALAGAFAIGALQSIGQATRLGFAGGIQPFWSAAAALTIGMLGACYGVTLFPRSDHALRMLTVTLGVAMAASLMIPLLGWVLLFTGLLHAARRLPQWWRLEEA